VPRLVDQLSAVTGDVGRFVGVLNLPAVALGVGAAASVSVKVLIRASCPVDRVAPFQRCRVATPSPPCCR
jgi:hypothetical protein